jgi:LmbE family N-acetylglucosaminyl deacetylase
MSASGQAGPTKQGSQILQDLRSFREMGSVLHVAAHPDDENTQLLTYLARGRGCRTAYLSLTRGDGGQNVLGPEFGSELGVIRTQELLAARRLDGAEQFFTLAKDFGFSKDYAATLTKWDKQQVLSDIVRVIRFWRPDVIVTRFSTAPGGTHGHHTASAVLALEAFKLAGDPKSFPEQLDTLTVWQPTRIVSNSGGGGKGGGLKLDIGGDDPVLGKPFSEIAGRSRAMHKSQGFGNFGGGGGKGGGGARTESFSVLRGEPATKDIFEGIDCTWGRVPGGAEVGQLTEKAIAQFNTTEPPASVPALLAIRSKVAALPTDPLVSAKRNQLDRVLQACLGISVTTTIDQAEVAAGQTISVNFEVALRGSKLNIPVRWTAVKFPNGDEKFKSANEAKELEQPAAGQPPSVVGAIITQRMKTNAPLTQPYWLRKDGPAGMFVVEDAGLIGTAENSPPFPVEYIFEVGGQKLVVHDEPVQITKDPKKGEVRRRLEVVAPISLNFAHGVKLFAPGASRPVEVDVTAYRPNSNGTLQLGAPAGWKIEPKEQQFNLAKAGDQSRLTFKVTAPSQPTSGAITASAKIGDAQYANRRVEINYDHLPPILLQPAARAKALSLEIAIRGSKVGYIPGAGDSVADCLEEMGYEVTQFTGADLTAEKLKNFDAVVIGIRAFNVRKDLDAGLPHLWNFVKEGGNVIVQYNRPTTIKLGPLDVRLSSERVTDENSDMKFLAPDHPAVNTPNKITKADFEGWVQERGIYFPTQWDKAFVPLFECHDVGAPPLKGGLLVAPYGRGHIVYTGFSWFRQLPEGVPGAYRLFANLVSLGK